MKSPNPANWEEFPEKNAVVLFAQSLMEALFDHTVDSFKAPALNVHSLAHEIRAVASDIKSGRMSAGALDPVLEEFQERFSACEVINKGACGSLGAYKRALAPKTNAAAVLDSVSALLVELSGGYWSGICREITSLVSSGTANRQLVELTHAFICECEMRGFTREDIYLRANAYFFKPRPRKRRISGPADVERFLAKFADKKVEEYEVVFFGQKGFFEIQELLKRMNIEVEAISSSELESKFVQEIAKSGVDAKLIVKDVKAIDISRAREIAEERVQFAVDIHRFLKHDGSLNWNRLAFVSSSGSSKTQTVRPATTPVMRLSGQKNAYSSLTEEDLVRVFARQVFGERSVGTIYSVLQYHRAALEATTPENQLLDLWAALEGLLPVPSTDNARIAFFITHVTPALSLTYAEKIFSYIDLCIRENSPKAASIIDRLEYSMPFQRTAALILCSDLQAERDRVLDLLKGNPLLLIRMRKARSAFLNGESVRRTIDSHRKKVSWHLQRIYAARNRVSHSASRLPHLETLVENLHSYLDALVSGVVRVGCSASTRTSVEAVLKILQVHEAGYLEDLRGKQIEPDTGNIIGSVFGEANPLNPSGRRMVG